MRRLTLFLPSQKALPREGSGGSDGGAPSSTVPSSDVAGPSAAAVAQPDVAGPSSTPATENEANRTEAGPDAVAAKRAPNEKGSLAPTVHLSWEKMMEMLKRVSCFTDAKAPSTKMSDFFPLTKWISLNMDGNPPSFVSA